jgi:uncharacterized protein YcgL (UPF0745 family)
MSDYPRLKEMGVQNPQDIAKFAIYTIGNTDILRIIYNRKKGSLLPVSKRYKFAQVKESVLVDSGSRETAMIYRSTDAFRNALHELEQLKLEKSKDDNLTALILEEIGFLEEDIALRTAYIKSLVNKI